MVLADQDVDGSHIKLLINVFSSLPSLFPSTAFVDDGHTHRHEERTRRALIL
jgi:DNA gyrase/topoisomerase IV subunit B